MGKKKLFEEIPCLEGERLTLRKLHNSNQRKYEKRFAFREALFCCMGRSSSG